MFYTVQELLAQIKGWEYIIAILFLALFILYWLALSREPKSRVPSQVARESSRSAWGRYLAGGGIRSGLSHELQASPCWEIRQCPQELRERCPAHALSPLPCWMARSLVAGKAWPLCDECSIYSQGMERLMVAARQRYGIGTSLEAGSPKQVEG